MYKIVFILFILSSLSVNVFAQQSDNGNGTYTNPVIWSDFPDNDVIRVGDNYYMVATTMYFFPGVPVLRSKDLVNWEYLTNAIPRFKQNTAYDMNGGTRYGHGQWASSIRYHNGKFYILFLTLDEGGFLCTADSAEGPWALHKLPRAFYDSGLFFDDDGKIYVVQGYSKLSLTRVDENLAPLTKDSVIFDKVQRKGLEGSHMYKINGYYFIYATYGGPDGYQVALRSKNIYGPYEEKVVLKDDMNQAGRGVHQGALVQTQTGEWWSVIFQDRGGEGRSPTLQPVHWIDGWPILGENGRAVVTYKKPDVGKQWPVDALPTSDEFNKSDLAIQWAWNHNPNDSCWSLSARKGFLRLTTANVASNLTLARNTLTQRMFGPYSIGTTVMDVQHMKDGDMAGLGILQMPYALLGVHSSGNGKFLLMVNNGKVIDSISITGHKNIFMRALAVTTVDKATFSYSYDNIHYHPIGDTLYMSFNLKMFTGNRFALFNYATKSTGGYVDFDWFRMKTRQGPPNLFNADSIIDAASYDQLSEAYAVVAKNPRLGLNMSLPGDGSWISFDRITFRRALDKMKIRYKSSADGKLIVYIDGKRAKPAGSIDFKAGAANDYQLAVLKLNIPKGVHCVTIEARSNDRSAVTLDWFAFQSTK